MPEEIAQCCIFYVFVIQYLLTTKRKSYQVNVNTFYLWRMFFNMFCFN